MKILVEWKDGDAWRQAHAQSNFSRRQNYYVKHDEKVYVFKDLKESTEVFSKVNNQWQRVGRITRYHVFLGQGQSYDEYMKSRGLQQGETVVLPWSKTTL